MYEKVYLEEEGYGQEVYHEWDDEKQQTVSYDKKAIEVTDEEYEQILKASKESSSVDEKNGVATAITVIAWVTYIAGFIVGIMQGSVKVEGMFRDKTEFSFAIAVTYWSVALISGTLCLGFAEIIKLLNNIKNK